MRVRGEEMAGEMHYRPKNVRLRTGPYPRRMPTAKPTKWAALAIGPKQPRSCTGPTKRASS